MDSLEPRLQWFCKELKTLIRGITDVSFLQAIEDPMTTEFIDSVCVSDGSKNNVIVFVAQEGDVFETQGDVLLDDSDEEWEEKEVTDDEGPEDGENNPEGAEPNQNTPSPPADATDATAEGDEPAIPEKKTKIIRIKKEKPPRYQKIFHQRLQVCMSFVPDRVNSQGALRCAFFLKHTPDAIISAEMHNMVDRDDSPMRLGFEYLVMDNPSLPTMQTIMTSVFIPLFEDGTRTQIEAIAPMPSTAQPTTTATDLASEAHGAEEGEEEEETETTHPNETRQPEIQMAIDDQPRELSAKAMIQLEVVQCIKRLDQSISGIINHVGAERKLAIPDIRLGESDVDIKAAAENDDLVAEIEEAVARWQVDINLVLDQEQQRELANQNRTPLGEIEFWKEKYNVLAGIYEQLNLPIVKTMLRVLSTAQNPTHVTFMHVSGSLTRHHNEAKDNVKFLNTLDRHFRALHTVVPGQSLQAIIDTLPSMMTAIRMVWIISRYFNTEDKMTGLLEKVANEIASKVNQHVSVKTLLKEPPEEAKRRLREGHQVLLKWKAAYNTVRDEIAKSEREQHWDFETKKLFDATDYMALRCQELIDIVGILEYYNNVLGSQLRQVLKESTSLDGIMKDVARLRKPIETVSFDPFDKKVGNSWEILHDAFRRNVEKLDADVRIFIEKIFDEDLRSSEAAFDLLLSFKNMQSRGGESVLDLKNILLQKADRILQKYQDELESVENIFKENRNNPPLTKNQPPIAGAIHWCGSLNERIKKPISRFLKEDILHTAKGQQIRAKYVKMCHVMKDYSTTRLADWYKEVKDTTDKFLANYILTKETGPNGKQVYVVNFNQNLFQIIQEAKYLDRLGFVVPDVALTVCLQEEQFHNNVENLKSMLANYTNELNNIDPPERAILRNRIDAMEKVLAPGFTRLNWINLTVPEYITKCNDVIREFRNISREVRKDAHHIQTQVVNRIASCCLVEDPRVLLPGVELIDVQDMADAMERHRQQQLDLCLRAYGNVPSLLRKIETNVAGSNTGKSKFLNGQAWGDDSGGYYHYWEKRICKALLKMVMMSISAFMTYLNLPTSKHIKLKKQPPLFRVIASLSGQEVVHQPPPQEITAVFQKVMDGIVESTRAFVRWMSGSCIDVPLEHIIPKITDEGAQHPFTYFNDIAFQSNVMKLKTMVYHGTRTPLSQLSRNTWKSMNNLWTTDKQVLCEKLLQRNLTWVEYDRRFHEYTKIMGSIDSNQIKKDFDFICVDQTPLLRDFYFHAKEWINLEGKQLYDQFKVRATKLEQAINKLDAEMHRKCDTVDDLKYVLTKIEEVRNSSLNVELQYSEIEYVYDSLAHYEVTNIAVEDRELAYALRKRWDDILAEAKSIDVSLSSTKTQFRAVTVKEVATFKTELEKAVQAFREKGPGRAGIDLDKGCILKDEWLSDLEEKQAKKNRLVNAESLFGLEITTYPDLAKLDDEIKKVAGVYAVYEDWRKLLNGWNKQQWLDVMVDNMVKDTNDYIKLLSRFKEVNRVAPHADVRQTVENFSKSLPLFTQLKSDAMQRRHWQELSQKTQKNIDFENFTFQNIVDMELFNCEAIVNDIVYNAGRELKIEQEIKGIKENWENMSFELAPYHRGNVPRGHVLKDTSTIQELVEENTMNLQSIQSVKWVNFFLEDVKLWMRKLSTITDVIGVWIVVQVRWQYLESIFIGSEDIASQLPKETKKFEELDKRWLRIMAETVEKPNVDVACHAADRLNELKYMAEKLEECQRELSNYLENKRCLFPRFFFISDDELLSILASNSPKAVQEHMLKMFDNCASLVFKPDSDIIEGVLSAEGERLDFGTAVNADGVAVEKWLANIITEMQSTLRSLLKASVYYYPKMDRLEWLKQYHGMLALAGSQVWWTWQVEDGFEKVKKGKKSAIKDLALKLTHQLEDLVGEMDKDLAKLYRKKVNTLVIVDVHARDIVDRFVRDSVMDKREFEWESQLRFYWEKARDTCVIEQCTGSFVYGYEYMGLNGRLVITPLTDRCFMTLTQALTFYLGGAPGGPAGTGKTESTKDLAKSLAYLCVVFNCGEGLDYKAMQTIFSGLSQSGAWGCFDEFNRIELPVLSVVSEQLRAIQAALKEKKTRFFFIDKDIQLDSKVGVFITMNPGYAGRVELPDNLKALFRPVVMAIPDMELICEIMLFSEGFKTARQLAKKMVTLYSLAKGQLSKQHHYDWGLRALKAVLVMAGQLKRSSPNLAEEAVLMRALRDMNAPKFVAEDEPLFKGLIGDLFPGLDPTRVPQENISRAATACLKENKLQPDIKQIDKVVQLYETMLTRHTSMVVGPTGGGKSTVISTLKGAQDELKVPTRLFFINPKAQTVSALYGFMEPLSRSWTDGLFSNIFRTINRPSTKEGADRERKYVVFDGDVDALWVENMNSVMDDNKLLTLPNGERIRLNPACSLLFEVGDLQYASPATVSRVGMVFVDQTNLGWKPYMLTWCSKRNKEEQETMRDLFDRYIQRLVDFVLDGIDDDLVTPPMKLVIPTSDLNMLRQLCRMMQCILPDRGDVKEPKILEAVFIFSCVWSFGAWVATDEDRVRFDIFLKKVSQWQIQDNGADMSRFVSAGSLPQTKTLYDYYFDLQDQKWKPWNSLVQLYEVPLDGKFSSILVPTVDTVRNSWLLDKIVNNNHACLFVGGSGTAKTVTIQRFLHTCKNKERNPNSEEVQLEDVLLEMNFSSRTTSLDAQRTLEDNVEKRTNTVLGAPPGKRLLVFVDDVNMPVVDTYGTQQPIAFLKLLIEYKAWYDRKDLLWKQVRDLQYLAAMAPPGGGRNTLDPRFVSLFTVFNIMFPSTESLEKIYEQILTAHLNNFDEAFHSLAKQITSITLGLYKEIVDALPATPTKFHYIFNLRDLSRIYEGLLRSSPEKITTPMALVRLWRNEVNRVFADRMQDEKDKSFVLGRISKVISDNFREDSDFIMADPLLFGDFKDFNPEDETGGAHLYEDMGEYTDVREVIEIILDDYNTPVVRMDLVMFEMALEHLLRIVRVISLRRGNCLLIGVGGSGKQSLTKLAGHTSQMGIFEITLSRGYNEDAFREDLKKLYFRCGVDREKLVFLFTDGHVAQEGFLELINNMLASGMVPALFTEEEKEPMYNSVMEELQALGVPYTKDNKWSAFVNRCRDNLHIVLSMSPSGTTLRTRCRNFPGLINNTTIDWFQKWPEQALHSVAAKMLLNETLPEEYRDKIIDHIVHAHLIADEECTHFHNQLRRYNYVTPKNFLDYLGNYGKFLGRKRQDIDDIVEKLGTGLERLQTASADVAVMSKDLAAKEIDLAEKTQKNEEMLAETSEKKQQTETKQKDALQAEEELNARSEQIAEESSAAEAVLAEALPELAAAEEELDKIDKRAIDEVRTFGKPSDRVVAVAKMICVLKSSEKPGWDLAKRLMMDPNFLKSLKTFPKHTLTDKKMRAIEDIRVEYNNPTHAEIMTSSSACAGLFTWVNSICKYYVVFKKVEPKKIRVQQLEQEKATSEKRLKMIKEEIDYLNENLQRLSERLEQGMAEAKALQEETALMQRRLDAAKRLLGGFTSERGRWQDEMGNLKEARVRLIGDCVVSAAFLSYSGPFTYGFRHKVLQDLWVPDVVAREIPITTPYKLEMMMTTDVEMSQWASNTLPTDELSVQNGMLTTGGHQPPAKGRKSQKVRFPLCIDPQMQAVRWIKATYAKNPRFEVASFSDPDFLKRLEFAIQYGSPFLFENVDEFIDPIIDPVLEQNFREEGGRRTIKLGDKDVDWDDNFRLYMCSKLTNPNYTPEVFGKTNVINYGVTLDGLENQLLNVVVAWERSDLQKTSEELVHTMAENKATLKNLEDSLIRELTLAKGNILDNDELISTLENTKMSAGDVAEKLKAAAENAEKIEINRQEYRPAAKRGAILYFVIGALSVINPMYEYSLSAFLQDVFRISLEKSTTAFEIPARLKNIMEYLTRMVYRYVCMGIFEKHKLMFAFQMAVKLLEGEGQLNSEEVDFFLRGCVLASKDFPANPCEFISERSWNDVCKLAQTSPVFKNLIEDVQNNVEDWFGWYNLEKPEHEKAVIPCSYREKTNSLQQLCLLRCFRPDRVYVAATQFIATCELMGKDYTSPPILRYTDVYAQSNCLSPIVCVVSPGANPTEEIINLSKTKDMDGKVKSTSLGQGQGEEAMRNVELGSVRGFWVLLQNCHLLIDWMRDLEKVLEKRDVNNKPHADFRLWLTTEPSDDFPISILQRSLKVVNEPPNGLKMNMKNTLTRVTEEQLEACHHPAFRPLVYTLAFFHAVVQERRKYGKIGWNVTYDFNETDFTISMLLLDTYLMKAHMKNDPIPWPTIRYLIGEAMYGGRVTDNADRRVVVTYLEEYFGDFLFDTFQPFHFYHNSEMDYCLPLGSTDLTKPVMRDAMLAHIEDMPMENSPEVFGLHGNAEAGYLRNATELMWANLIDLMPRKEGAAGGGSDDDSLSQRAKEILDLIPAPFDRKLVMRQEREKSRNNGYDGSLQPIQVVLVQELDRWNNLVNIMVRTLKDLRRAIAGEIGMSADLDDLEVALRNGQLPAPWRKRAPATRKNLGRWLVHFERRYKQFQTWVDNGQPLVMWLSGLMIPESFISALVQITCRKYTWPLDKSSIFTRVTHFRHAEDVEEPPKDGVFVSGLYIEGAQWDLQKKCLMPQDPKVLIYELPVLEIIPMETSRIKLVDTFRTPVYVTSDRRNAAGVGLAFEADLGSKEHSSHWVLESVALMLNSDD